MARKYIGSLLIKLYEADEVHDLNEQDDGNYVHITHMQRDLYQCQVGTVKDQHVSLATPFKTARLDDILVALAKVVHGENGIAIKHIFFPKSKEDELRKAIVLHQGLLVIILEKVVRL